MSQSIIEKIVTKSPHLNWMIDYTVLLVRHGSHAYGTNTPASDEDFKGIAIPTKKYFLGACNKFEQAELKEPDTVIYDIRKFFDLASACNPNIIEVLHTDPADHVIVDPIGEIILDHKDDFLSKRIKHTFLGYAVSQLKRIKTHKKWIMNPPSAPPTRAEMGLPEQTLIPQDQLMAAEAAIQKELDRFQFDFMDYLDEPSKIEVRNIMTEMLAELKITTDDQWQSAARKIGLDDNFIALMYKERQYAGKKKEWDQYMNWKKTRNPARAALEEKYGYDCYVEETEFLTENGWKKFCDITPTDKLASVYLGSAQNRTFLGLEYQNYTERFEGNFTGNLYNLLGNHVDTLVTPNHRLLIQERERKSNKTYDWELREIANLPDTFNILYQITPNVKNYSDQALFNWNNIGIPDKAFLRLMGWYLSDGSMSFNSNKEPDDVRVSQIKNGKLYSSMKKFVNKYKEFVPCSLYEYERPPNDTHEESFIEATLSVRGHLPNVIFKECGSNKNKRVPRWVFKLSKYKMDILLNALIGGDGAIFRPDNSIIFYNSLKGLADDAQELALLCGYETSLYGPYESIKIQPDGSIKKVFMYHVHINKTREQIKKLIRSKNIKTINVENKKIVCFTVPNGTLITRLNGHIGMHGNSKHAYHLVRLIRMCRETLTTGKVIVKRPDREELLAIRNGAWTYDQLMEFVEKEDTALNELYNSTNVLPKTPDREKLDALCIELVEMALSKYSWYNIKKNLSKIF